MPQDILLILGMTLEGFPSYEMKGRTIRSRFQFVEDIWQEIQVYGPKKNPDYSVVSKRRKLVSRLQLVLKATPRRNRRTGGIKYRYNNTKLSIGDTAQGII